MKVLKDLQTQKKWRFWEILKFNTQ